MNKKLSNSSLIHQITLQLTQKQASHPPPQVGGPVVSIDLCQNHNGGLTPKKIRNSEQFPLNSSGQKQKKDSISIQTSQNFTSKNLKKSEIMPSSCKIDTVLNKFKNVSYFKENKTSVIKPIKAQSTTRPLHEIANIENQIKSQHIKHDEHFQKPIVTESVQIEQLETLMTRMPRNYSSTNILSKDLKIKEKRAQMNSPNQRQKPKVRNIKSPGRRINTNCEVYYIDTLRQALNCTLPSLTLTEEFRDHFQQTYNALQFTKDFQKGEGHKPINIQFTNKKLLIFDLDETLIHCNDDCEEKSDVQLEIQFNTGEKVMAGINIRPYAREILKNLSSIYEIGVFTASHQCYASKVLNYLDPKNEIKHKFYRESCLEQNGLYLKDLRILNKDLKNVILVDNAAYSFCLQLSNGVPIIPFYDDKQDTQLQQLEKFLLKIKDVNDVRTVISQTFKTEQMLNLNYQQTEELFKK